MFKDYDYDPTAWFSSNEDSLKITRTDRLCSIYSTPG